MCGPRDATQARHSAAFVTPFFAAMAESASTRTRLCWRFCTRCVLREWAARNMSDAYLSLEARQSSTPVVRCGKVVRTNVT